MPIYMLCIFLLLTNCAHYADLKNETKGSIAGSVLGGVLAGTKSGGDLILVGAGTILGSIGGSIIGTAFDESNRTPLVDPMEWPIKLDCYDTYRPLHLASFCPAISTPPDMPDKFGKRYWHDDPLL